MAESFSIGQLSQQTGCKITTIRWYEQQGLLPKAGRSTGNQRRYGMAHLTNLRFLLHARELGFDLAATRQLLSLNGNNYHDHLAADRIALEQRNLVRDKMQRLKALDRELTDLIDNCQFEAGHQCNILEVLAQPAQQEDNQAGI